MNACQYNPTINQATVKTIDLPIKEWCISWLQDNDIPLSIENLSVVTECNLRGYCDQFMVHMRLPEQVIQENKVVASYPTTLWDHVKERLGWKHNRTVHKLSEYWTFPHIEVPKYCGHPARIRVHTFTMPELGAYGC